MDWLCSPQSHNRLKRFRHICLAFRFSFILERIIAYVMASEQRTVAPETILNYIKYCCDTYLFYQVKSIRRNIPLPCQSPKNKLE